MVKILLDNYDNATEVISMGFELMYTQPVKFKESDPEHFGLILDVMNGRYKKAGQK